MAKSQAEVLQAALNLIQAAAEENQLCIAICRAAVSQEPVPALCVRWQVGEETRMVPVAKVFDSDPFEQLLPPTDDFELKHERAA